MADDVFFWCYDDKKLTIITPCVIYAGRALSNLCDSYEWRNFSGKLTSEELERRKDSPDHDCWPTKDHLL